MIPECLDPTQVRVSQSHLLRVLAASLSFPRQRRRFRGSAVAGTGPRAPGRPVIAPGGPRHANDTPLPKFPDQILALVVSSGLDS